MTPDCKHGADLFCARCQPERVAAILKEEYARLDRKYFQSEIKPYSHEVVFRQTPSDYGV